MSEKRVRIGGASGFWGDAARATPHLLADGRLDFIVYDYLAEITMSIMARARLKDNDKGYATDFVSAAMVPNLQRIADQGVRVVSNAGGVNPQACATALRAAIADQGLELTVACITGDDLMAWVDDFVNAESREMFSGEALPDAERLLSMNAYLGAFPIAAALDAGADIVITGRCVDSAVTLGACIHSFGWTPDDLDALAMGSLAGHILECGTQATGGNFTDWEAVEDISTIGYPIAEVSADGSFICSKPEGSGGLVSEATVGEQMLYEIGDPQAYILPDVICDFSEVKLEQIGEDRVQVSGARGYPPPDSYKVSATFIDQFRGGTYMTFYGLDAERKARAMAEAVFKSSRKMLKVLGLADFSETDAEVLGAESQFGHYAEADGCREVVLKVAAKHPEMAGIGVMLKEAVGLALATPPGLSGFAGTRSRPSPVVRLFSFLADKTDVSISIQLGDTTLEHSDTPGRGFDPGQLDRPHMDAAEPQDDWVDLPLIRLAWGRSGDKGDKANVGVIARRPEYLPYILASFDEKSVAQRFEHFLASDGDGAVERYLLPGIHAVNFLLHDVLGGGGVASLRNDPQGKGYAQLLLAAPVRVPPELAEELQ
ncbi:MAG: acyclic terpene utilization AtuA family protein [Pseudomonadota bacterium]